MFVTIIAFAVVAYLLWMVIVPCLPEREDEQLLAVATAAHFDAQWSADQEQAEKLAWLEAQAEYEEDRLARRQAKRERKARLAGELAEQCWPLMRTDGSPEANRRAALAAEAYDHLIDVALND